MTLDRHHIDVILAADGDPHRRHQADLAGAAAASVTRASPSSVRRLADSVEPVPPAAGHRPALGGRALAQRPARAGHVEVRLAGRDPELVYVDEPVVADEPPAPGDDLSARITLRLPDGLKASLEAAAAREGISTNAWIVRALARALEPRASAALVESAPGLRPELGTRRSNHVLVRTLRSRSTPTRRATAPPASRRPARRRSAPPSPPGSSAAEPMPTFETPGRVGLRLDVPGGPRDGADVGRAAGRRRRHAGARNDEPSRAPPPPRRGSRRRERGGRHEITVRVPKREAGRFGISWGRGPELEVVVRCPEGSDSSSRRTPPISRRSGRSASSASAPPRVTSTCSTRRSSALTTASGDLSAGAVAGTLTVKSASGDVDVQAVAGKANVGTVSGDLQLGRAGEAATLSTVSGDIDLELAEAAVRVNSVSGDVAVAMRPGLSLWLDVQSVSGDDRLGARRRRRACGRRRAGRAARPHRERRRAHRRPHTARPPFTTPEDDLRRGS